MPPPQQMPPPFSTSPTLHFTLDIPLSLIDNPDDGSSSADLKSTPSLHLHLCLVQTSQSSPLGPAMASEPFCFTLVSFQSILHQEAGGTFPKCRLIPLIKALPQLSCALISNQTSACSSRPGPCLPPPQPHNLIYHLSSLCSLSCCHDGFCSSSALTHCYATGPLHICSSCFPSIFPMPSPESILLSFEGCYTNVISLGRPSRLVSPTRPVSL